MTLGGLGQPFGVPVCEATLRLPGPHACPVSPETRAGTLGRRARVQGVGPWASASVAWGTGQAPWAVTAAPGLRGQGRQAWKAHRRRSRTGRAGLCPGCGAVPVFTSDRVAGTGTLWLFTGVRSSQPSRPPVSLGPWAPPASQAVPLTPEAETAPASCCAVSPGSTCLREPVVGQVGTRASWGRSWGSDLECRPPPASAFSLHCC